MSCSRLSGTATSARHIAAHDVTLDEVREAVLERPCWTVPGRDGTTLVYGQTYAGRYLLVVAVDEDGQAFVVTARDMTDAEKKDLPQEGTTMRNSSPPYRPTVSYGRTQLVMRRADSLNTASPARWP